MRDVSVCGGLVLASLSGPLDLVFILESLC